MTKKTTTDQTDDATPGAEEVKDEALDQAEGGFSLSGNFTKTSTINTFTKFNGIQEATVSASDPTDTVDTKSLRVRPGRIGGWSGGS